MLSRYDLRKNFSNGDSYAGEATEDNVKDGKGTYKWAATGATYSGQWKKNQMHGDGVLTVPSSGTVEGFQYIGCFAKGERQGKGRCIFDDGRKYEGSWENGQMHGVGKLAGSPRDSFVEYVGNFVAGKRHGRGKMEYRNGDIYEGIWEEDARHGLGVQKFSPSVAEVVYEGQFRNDAITGKGKMTYRSGEVYEGFFESGLKHGEGKQRMADGSGFIGAFSRGTRHGFGEMSTDSNALVSSSSIKALSDIVCPKGGFCYKGNWYYGQWEGKGLFAADPNSRECQRKGNVVWYEGAFVSDEFCTSDDGGAAIGKFADGSEFQGSWERNKPHGKGVQKKCNFPVKNTLSWRLNLLGDDDAEVEKMFRCIAMKYEGDFVSGERHGKGVCEFHFFKGNTTFVLTVDIFDGEWSHNLPNGVGKWHVCVETTKGKHQLFTSVGSSIQSRDLYEGPVRNGLPNGKDGSLLYRDGRKYKGSFADGLPGGGEGRMTYANDDYYEGEWMDGLYHGTGIFYESYSSNSYKGEWVAGAKDGQGVEIEYGKSHFTGAYKSNSRNGHGVLKFNNGDCYEGYFANGKYDGNGSLVLLDGTKHVGQFSKGKLHGHVESTFPNGTSYIGQYTNGAITGHGEMRLLNKDRYIGDFVDGVKEGKGRFVFAEGSVLVCSWKNNVVHGEGEFISRDGATRTKRVYNEGNLVEEKSTFSAADELPHPQPPPVPRPAKQSFSVPIPPTTTPTQKDEEAVPSAAITASSTDNNSSLSPPKAIPLSLRAHRSDPQDQSTWVRQPSAAPSSSASPSAGGSPDVRIRREALEASITSLEAKILELQGEVDSQGVDLARKAALKRKVALLRASKLREVRHLQSLDESESHPS